MEKIKKLFNTFTAKTENATSTLSAYKTPFVILFLHIFIDFC